MRISTTILLNQLKNWNPEYYPNHGQPYPHIDWCSIYELWNETFV